METVFIDVYKKDTYEKFVDLLSEYMDNVLDDSEYPTHCNGIWLEIDCAICTYKPMLQYARNFDILCRQYQDKVIEHFGIGKCGQIHWNHDWEGDFLHNEMRKGRKYRILNKKLCHDVASHIISFL
jgi:hypothetical protein